MRNELLKIESTIRSTQSFLIGSTLNSVGEKITDTFLLKNRKEVISLVE